MSVSNQLRNYIYEHAEDRYGSINKFVQATGISWGSVSRFLKERGNISLDNFDIMCQELKLELRERDEPTREDPGGLRSRFPK